MSKYSWDDETNRQISRNCIRCHYRDQDPDICHAMDPPIIKDDVFLGIVNNDCWSCGFIPDSQWERIPQERKSELEELKRQRSEKYYGKR